MNIYKFSCKQVGLKTSNVKLLGIAEKESLPSQYAERIPDALEGIFDFVFATDIKEFLFEGYVTACNEKEANLMLAAWQDKLNLQNDLQEQKNFYQQLLKEQKEELDEKFEKEKEHWEWYIDLQKWEKSIVQLKVDKLEKERDELLDKLERIGV